MTVPLPPGESPQQQPGSQPMPEGERAELVRLRKEISYYQNRQVGGQVWRPGMRVPEGAAEAARDVEADYRREVAEEARKASIRLDARRIMAAEGWSPPSVTEALAAELKRPRQTHRYRIGGLAGWNHNVLLAGPRKTGKTQLAVNLAAGLSLSSLTINWAALWESFCGNGEPPGWQWAPGPFLGLSECFMGGKVGYINAEMDAEDWRDTFRALPAMSYDASRIYPVHCRGIALPVIGNPAAREWFTGWLRERDIEVLIIDTWGAFCAKNGVRNFNDDAEARVISDGLDGIKEATGVASVIVLIHMPHQTGERHMERFKGAGAVGDWADVLWSYVQDPEGIRYLSATGRARIDAAESALWFDRGTGLLAWAGGDRVARETDSMRGRIIAAVRDQPGILTEPLLDAAGGHRNKARELARRMARDKELRTEQEGRATHWFPPDVPGHTDNQDEAAR